MAHRAQTSRLHPTSLGWYALLFSVLGMALFPLLQPTRLAFSWEGTFVQYPVHPRAWLAGSILILASALVIAEAFRRGSPMDKALAALATLFALVLLIQPELRS